MVIPPQRKTGGRGEHINLEQRFRVKFNDAGEILLITQYHFCQKKRKKDIVSRLSAGDILLSLFVLTIGSEYMTI